MAYGESPFESASTEIGGSIAMAIQNGRYQIPNEPV
jgi:hypothetical protein